MRIELVKYSMPGWEKQFDTMDAAVTELRKHICESCLVGPQLYVGEGGTLVEMDFPEDPPIDIIHDGVRYECRDAQTLLGTSCGCEYGIEGDVPWSDDHDSDDPAKAEA